MVRLLAFRCLKCKVGVLGNFKFNFLSWRNAHFSLKGNGLCSEANILHKNVISQLLWFDI